MWRFPLVNDACISLRLVIGSKATMEFKPGHEYIYKVKITRTGVSATGTITQWSSVEKDEVTAE